MVGKENVHIVMSKGVWFFNALQQNTVLSAFISEIGQKEQFTKKGLH